MALKEITDRLRGVEFDLITSSSNHNLPRRERLGNVNVYRITETFNFLLPKTFYPLAAFLKALQLRKRFGRYDMIFALQASQGAGAAWLYKLLNPKAKFILNIQEGKNLEKQGFLINLFRKIIIKRADVITAISNYLAEYARKINPGADIRVIPNGVDLNKFKNLSRASRGIQNPKSPAGDLGSPLRDSGTCPELLEGFKNNERIIITISRLVPKNGIADLIEACRKLQTPNSKLLIIGGGPLEESLRFQVKRLKLEDKVSIVGGVSHDQVPEYLARADVFVRPSLSEGLGTAFLEAMACGVPIIGTAQGGIVDFLEERKTGLFCRAGDSKDIADKIDLLLSDEDLRENIIANARKAVEARYSWDKIADQYATLFSLGLTRLRQGAN